MSARSLFGFLFCGVALWGLVPAQVYAADAVDGAAATADSLNAGGASATSIGNAAGTTVNGPATINGGLTQAGTTNLNTTGNAATNIGNASSTTAVLGTANINATGSGTTNIGNASSTTTMSGATSINNNVNATTSINTGTSTGSVSVGNSANTTSLLSATNNIGTAAGYASVNTLGNTETATTVTARAGQSTMALTNTTAATSIAGGASTLGAGTTTVSSSLSNSGGAGILVDSRGKLTSGAVTETTAALTVTNGQGNTHGFVVTEHAATISGGTTSNSLTINDAGATFGNSDTGAAIKVTGVADGTSQYDAVNYGQVAGLATAVDSELTNIQNSINSLDSKMENLHKNMAGGIASVAAMSALPTLEKGKKFAIGMGTGYFDSQAGLAFGFTGRFNKRVVGKVGLAVSPSSPESNAVANAGISYAW